MTSKEYVVKILSLVEPQTKEYDESIIALSNQADKAKKVLLQINPQEFKHIEIGEAFQFLLNVCRGLIFFPDKVSIMKLKQLGITYNVYRWFIPIEKIESEFKKIDNKNILVLKSIALHFILMFLQSKIRVALYKNAKTIFKIKTKVASNEDPILVSNKIFRRREYANGDSLTINDPLEYIINLIAGEFEKQFADRTKAKIELRKQVEGTAETYYLYHLVGFFIPTKETQQTYFLYCLGSLFRLISKDRIIWTKAQYENRESSYKNNYRRYVASRIKKITGYDQGTNDIRQILDHPIFEEGLKL